MKLDGIIVPLITPLTPDESLDERGLEKLIEHVIAGVVDQNINLAEFGKHRVHHLRDLILKAHVTRKADDLAPRVCGDALRCCARLLDFTAGDCHIGAGFGKRGGDVESQVARAAGHQRNASAQIKQFVNRW